MTNKSCHYYFYLPWIVRHLSQNLQTSYKTVDQSKMENYLSDLVRVLLGAKIKAP